MSTQGQDLSQTVIAVMMSVFVVAILISALAQPTLTAWDNANDVIAASDEIDNSTKDLASSVPNFIFLAIILGIVLFAVVVILLASKKVHM